MCGAWTRTRCRRGPRARRGERIRHASRRRRRRVGPRGSASASGAEAVAAVAPRDRISTVERLRPVHGVRVDGEGRRGARDRRARDRRAVRRGGLERLRRRGRRGRRARDRVRSAPAASAARVEWMERGGEGLETVALETDARSVAEASSDSVAAAADGVAAAAAREIEFVRRRPRARRACE